VTAAAQMSQRHAVGMPPLPLAGSRQATSSRWLLSAASSLLPICRISHSERLHTTDWFEDLANPHL